MPDRERCSGMGAYRHTMKRFRTCRPLGRRTRSASRRITQRPKRRRNRKQCPLWADNSWTSKRRRGLRKKRHGDLGLLCLEARNCGYERPQGCCGGAGVVSGGFGGGFSGEPGELGFELLGWPKGLAFEG